ncbi:Bacterial regulatory protein, luxR family [compost metagenome]
MALKLSLSEKTVKYYMTNVMQKLHARNRVEAVTAVRRHWETQKSWHVNLGAERPLSRP